MDKIMDGINTLKEGLESLRQVLDKYLNQGRASGSSLLIMKDISPKEPLIFDVGDIKNQLIINSASLTRLNNKLIGGRLSFDDEMRAKNSLIASVLLILTRIELFIQNLKEGIRSSSNKFLYITPNDGPLGNFDEGFKAFGNNFPKAIMNTQFSIEKLNYDQVEKLNTFMLHNVKHDSDESTLLRFEKFELAKLSVHLDSAITELNRVIQLYQ